MSSLVSAQKALVDCAAQGLARLDDESLVALATALWYEDYVPEVANLPENFRADAAYVVDALTRVSPLPKTSKDFLLATLAPLRPTHLAASPSRDPLAKAWGASSDLSRFWPRLLPLQRRTYQDERKALSVTVVASVRAVLREFDQARLFTDDGLQVGFNRRTPGVDLERVAEGQVWLCELSPQRSVVVQAWLLTESGYARQFSSERQ